MRQQQPSPHRKRGGSTDQMVGEYHHMRPLLGHERTLTRLADAYGIDEGSVLRAITRRETGKR